MTLVTLDDGSRVTVFLSDYAAVTPVTAMTLVCQHFPDAFCDCTGNSMFLLYTLASLVSLVSTVRNCYSF